MAGIYIHIPFCRQACHYCDFHFSTSLKGKNDFLNALKKEISLQKDYLKDSPLNPLMPHPLTPSPPGEGEGGRGVLEVRPGAAGVGSIYFGGGTPSVLSKEELLEIFSELSKYFSIDRDAEITLEANPDDLSKQKLKELAATPVNRLSIGIQSFSNIDLKFLNRVHDSKTASASVKYAQEAGFKNITIDLIYGIQTLTHTQWKKNLKQAFDLNVQHLSCYSLTVEQKTPLASFIKKGKVKDISSEKSAEQFEILMKEAQRNDFIHYEISNFCRPSPTLPEGKGVSEEFGYMMADKLLYGLLKEFMKNNRSNPTEAERILWENLKGNKLNQYHFRRQHIIGKFIADFVCLKHRLVIEIDGLIHQLPDNIESDENRTKWLNEFGFTVIRFANEEVIYNMDKVLEKITKQLNILPEIKRETEVLPFGKDLGWASKHNSNYWKGEKYIGLGPSAHSYDGNSRQWNVRSNSAYIQSLAENKIPYEKEVLTENQKYNEYVMISLRTMWGIDIKFVKEKFSEKLFNHLCETSFRAEQRWNGRSNRIEKKHGKLFLTQKGKLFADKIAADLFIV